MKKLFKKTAAIILTAAIAMSVGAPAFANVNNVEESINPSTEISTRAHDVDTKREFVDTNYQWVRGLLVSGQPRSGTRVSSGYLSCNPSGGSSTTVTLGLAYGSVNVAVTPGSFSGTISAPSSFGVSAPAIPNKYCLLYVDKRIGVERYAIYEKFSGTSQDWHFVRYEYSPFVDEVDAYCRVV